MENRILSEEKNKLPLNFKYINKLGSKKSKELNKKIFYVECDKYQTDFMTRVTPFKAFTRML
jgi:hypothetical protein